jgi:hypothetical protein
MITAAYIQSSYNVLIVTDNKLEYLSLKATIFITGFMAPPVLSVYP